MCMQGALSLNLSLYVSLTNELSHHAMRNQANELLNQYECTCGTSEMTPQNPLYSIGDNYVY